jgi:hypothetical protein
MALALAAFWMFKVDGLAAETNSIAAPKFLGAQSCSASSCHGGAGDKSNQYTIWSTRDFHHARPYATLQTARSERLAEVLKIGNPTQSARCAVCHAPFQTVPAERLGKEAKVAEGISCETCHGPAENWIRSHTRPDYTHADRVAAGMRDLKNLYVCANTCVACHQNLDPEIRAAGHPELIFEMDGQSVTMPRHWRDERAASDRWFIGQAVAARETSWQLLTEKSANEELLSRWAGLIWVLQAGQSSKINLSSPSSEDFKLAQENYDQFAKQVAMPGDHAMNTQTLVENLASASDAFTNNEISKSIQARRAERLALALDRLIPELSPGVNNPAVTQSLNKLFADAQSLPDFDPNQFAKDLKEFHSSVAGILESK